MFSKYVSIVPTRQLVREQVFRQQRLFWKQHRGHVIIGRPLARHMESNVSVLGGIANVDIKRCFRSVSLVHSSHARQKSMMHLRAASTGFDPFWLLSPKIPGFDHFDRKPSEKKDEDDKAEENSTDESSSTSENVDEKATKGEHDDPKVEAKGTGPSGDNNDDNNNQKSSNGKNNNEFDLLQGLVLAAFLYMLVSSSGVLSPGNEIEEFPFREISWNEFVQYLLERNQVEKIVVGETSATIILKAGAPGLPSKVKPSGSGGAGAGAGADEYSAKANDSYKYGRHQAYRMSIGSVESLERKLDEAQRSMGVPPENHVPVQYTNKSSIAYEFLQALPSLVVVGILLYISRNSILGFGGAGKGGGGGIGGIFQVGKSTAKKINKEDVTTTFKDVAGCQEAKKEIMEFVEFLKEPARFTKLGAKLPKGALLCGPPGTGKTLLAKAVAGEAGVSFFTVSGSDFIEMFVGVGPARVRDLFKDARANAPCVIFIDEIDAVGRRRGRGGMGGNDERENTLNQLLVEMDGFSPLSGVIVLAGTNRIDILDSALTRPGRFDRTIQIDKPDLLGRKEIFLVHLRGVTLEDKAESIAGRLAGLTPGFAGADIANICNEAAIFAARRKSDTVAMKDFEAALDRVIGGMESNKIMSSEERSIVAHHEAGHAVAGWFLEHANPLLKVTIIPRSSGALGFAQYLPKEVFLRTHAQIMDIVCMTLAGRAAEEIFFGRVTTGASDDLRRVTDLVYQTIQVYGMNERLGQLAFPKDPNATFDERPYSDATAMAMDEEAKIVIDDAYQRTLTLLREKKNEVALVAATLLDKETLTHDDIVELVGPRPFQADKQYEDFLSRNKEEKEAVEEVPEEAETNENDIVNPGVA